jgi:hypothetical protein
MAVWSAENFIYEEWRRHARLASSMRGAEREAEEAMADALQRLLEDYSSYGHSLVWGSEGRRREKERR